MSLPSSAALALSRPSSHRSAALPVLVPNNRASLRDVTFLPTEADDELDLRQLRHHTKNALQRILGLIAQAPGLHDTPEGERIALELEQRIQLSATISNALFGLTQAPGSMTQRLRSLGHGVIDLLRDPMQLIRLEVSVRGQCPAALRETVLRVAHEVLGNAVKHGMRGRRTGRISIRLESGPASGTRLTISDDGRGFVGEAKFGEGLNVAQGLAEQFGGNLTLSCERETMAVLTLPHGQRSGTL